MDRTALARRLEGLQVDFVRGAAAECIPVGEGCAAANGVGSYVNKAVGFGIDGEPSDFRVVLVKPGPGLAPSP